MALFDNFQLLHLTTVFDKSDEVNEKKESSKQNMKHKMLIAAVCIGETR